MSDDLWNKDESSLPSSVEQPEPFVKGVRKVNRVTSGPAIVTRRRRSSSRTSSKNLKSTTDISPASKIFRNLLILEDDLRRQAREQKLLKWQFTLFLSSLMGVAGFAFYELYFSQENIQGLYRVMLQFIFVFIMITVVLFHLSGEYRRTIVIPRKFFTNTNKGIRKFNFKLVKVKTSFSDQVADLVRFISRSLAQANIWLLKIILPASYLENAFPYRFWRSVEIRSQPRIGAVNIKLVLYPRAFSAEIREGWEIYRDEFWAREGARRRRLVNQLTPKKE
ncbi:HBL074Cp [Eremothecium sinecaudum]|uniref:HBL074Cp n=1 Tax=Eremothecium sinecaudum TaxID=45286 RepID=A0A109UWF9_9SACH|nr:HBL074Cp [Eremothecium sinecaudum]AMD18828.1 HBL074Cp [Eremothecium sinecaudum]